MNKQVSITNLSQTFNSWTIAGKFILRNPSNSFLPQHEKNERTRPNWKKMAKNNKHTQMQYSIPLLVKSDSPCNLKVVIEATCNYWTTVATPTTTKITTWMLAMHHLRLNHISDHLHVEAQPMEQNGLELQKGSHFWHLGKASGCKVMHSLLFLHSRDSRVSWPAP